jgi:glycosyltransferase involved in cell wall biosynthesis
VRVLIVGGVYGQDEAYRRSINPTPEMTLEAGLRRRGVEVVVAPHSWSHSLTGIDIVHVHHLAKSVPGLAACRAVRPTPVVFTRHNEERTLPAKRAAALWLINRTADACVALSHQEANRLRHEVRGRVVVIRNGIDAPADLPPVLPRQEGPWRLLFAGQLIRIKGLDVLFRALATVRPEIAVTLRMVYHNSEQLTQLQTLAEQLSINDIVTFVGRRDNAGMLEEYRLADALVLPSLADSESLPSVITESLLAHKPVVASAVAAIPEQVQDAGVLVPPGDDGALASAIMRLISDYSGYVTKAQARAREVKEEYAVETMIDRHLDLYESLLQVRKSTAKRPARATGR